MNNPIPISQFPEANLALYSRASPPELLASRGTAATNRYPYLPPFAVIAQTAHGFVFGDAVALKSDGTWALASQAALQFDTPVGLVEKVINANTFAVRFDGFMNLGGASAYSALTAGAVYWLSPTTAGLCVASAPAVGKLNRQVFTCISASEVWVTGNATGKYVPPATIQEVTQVSHGLAEGDLIRSNSSSQFLKAQADSESTINVVGMVVSVIGANQFVYVTSGVVPYAPSGLTPGAQYYLSSTTAGSPTSTAPTIVKPVFVALTGSTVVLQLSAAGSTSGGGGGGTGTLPNFVWIEEVDLSSGLTDDTWVTKDISSNVPVGAAIAILFVQIAEQADVSADLSTILARSGALGVEITLLSDSTVVDDAVTVRQVVALVPLSLARSFQLKANYRTADLQDVQVLLQGYVINVETEPVTSIIYETPLADQPALVLSTNQTVALNHGLSATPHIVNWTVVCITNDSPFVVGDELDVADIMAKYTSTPGYNSVIHPFFQTSKTSTQVIAKYNGASLMSAYSAAAGFGTVNLVATRWKLKATAIRVG